VPKFIFLTDQEGRIAALVGVERHIQSRRRCYQNRYGAKENESWQIDIEGACGEMAVAKYLGIYWGGHTGTFKKADVGNNQVRTTSEPNGRLIVRERDNPEQRYWLVIGTFPNYWIHGYIKGEDAQRDEWLDDPDNRPPAWFVPREFLTLDLPIE